MKTRMGSRPGLRKGAGPLLLPILLIFAVLAAPSSAQIQSNDADGVDVAMDAYLAGWNNHDPRSMAAAFAEDGDLINPFGVSAKGRANVEKAFAKEQSSLTKNSSATFQIRSLRKLRDGLILADADGAVSGVMRPDGKTLPDIKNHVVIIFSKRGDVWQILTLRAYAFTCLPGVSDTAPAVPGALESPPSNR
jgi:uncharacterized protein (TIGR02246 family)